MSFKILSLLILSCLSNALGQISLGPSNEISSGAFYPINTIAVDLDHDGDLDILAHEASYSRVIWYLNDGNGIFDQEGEWLAPIDDSSAYWQTLGFIDYDEDGDLDIIGFLRESDLNTQTVCLVKGTGDGSFEEDYSQLLAHSYDPDDGGTNLDTLKLPPMDFDGDGRKDLLFEEHVVLLGDDPPVLIELETSLEGYDRYSDGKLLIDWNNDNRPDLVEFSSASRFWPAALLVKFNQGDGSFSAPETVLTLPFVTNPSPDLWQIERSNGSNELELLFCYDSEDIDFICVITRTSDNSAIVSEPEELNDQVPPLFYGGELINDGNGRIFITGSPEEVGTATCETYRLQWDGSSFSVEPFLIDIPAYTLGLNENEMIEADLDGDSVLDLVVTTNGPNRITDGPVNEIFWLKSKIGGSYETARKSILKPSLGQKIWVASDLDQDGYVDIVTHQQRSGSTLGDLVFWKNIDNASEFIPHQLPGANTIHKVLGVFDTDESLAILGGVFSELDWNEDGKGFLVYRKIFPELRGGTYQYHLSFIAQDATGQFFLLDYLSFDSQQRLSNIYYEDFNGDGINDLLHSERRPAEAGQAFAFVTLRPGLPQSHGFAPPIFTLEGMTLDGPPRDIDDDNDLDFEVYKVTPGNWVSDYLWFQNELSGFEERGRDEAGYQHAPSYSREITLLDLDMDGDLDKVTWKAARYVSPINRLVWIENKNTSDEEVPNPSEFDVVTGLRPRWAMRDSHLMADLDNDGVEELIVGSLSSSSRLEWFEIVEAEQPPEYLAWASENTISGHSSAPLANWDGDSMNNWEEFAFGSNPRQADENHLGRPRVTTTTSGPTFTFHRRDDAHDLGITYQFQQSPDLMNWSPWIPENETATAINPEYELVSFPLDLPRSFLQLQPMIPASDL